MAVKGFGGPAGGRPVIGGTGGIGSVIGPLVVITSEDGHLVTTSMGEGPAQVTDGYGGFAEIDRPRRKPATVFGGSPLERMTVPLLFDGYRTDTSVEPQITTLETMAKPRGDLPPPWVRIALPGGSPRPSSVRWVIEGFDWGDVIVGDDGERTRQFVTLSVKEYVPLELVQVVSPSKRRATSASTSGTTTATVTR